MFDRAWTVVRKGETSIYLRHALAQASEATHPREAIETCAERVGHHRERNLMKPLV